MCQLKVLQVELQLFLFHQHIPVTFAIRSSFYIRPPAGWTVHGARACWLQGSRTYCRRAYGQQNNIQCTFLRTKHCISDTLGTAQKQVRTRPEIILFRRDRTTTHFNHLQNYFSKQADNIPRSLEGSQGCLLASMLGGSGTYVGRLQTELPYYLLYVQHNCSWFPISLARFSKSCNWSTLYLFSLIDQLGRVRRIPGGCLQDPTAIDYIMHGLRCLCRCT